MKTLIFFLVTFMSITVSSANDLMFQSSDTLFVNSFSGLNMRSAPHLDAPIVGTLTHGKRVLVQSISAKEEIIENRKSRWVQVKAKGRIGYLFGGFLSSVKPMKLTYRNFDCESAQTYRDWLAQQLIQSDITSQEYELIHSDTLSVDCTEYMQTIYADGQLDERNKLDRSVVSYLGTGISINDVLNFMDYYAASRTKYCGMDDSFSKTLIVPIHSSDGSVKAFSSHYPHTLSVKKMNEDILVEMNLSI